MYVTYVTLNQSNNKLNFEAEKARQETSNNQQTGWKEI